MTGYESLGMTKAHRVQRKSWTPPLEFGAMKGSSTKMAKKIISPNHLYPLIWNLGGPLLAQLVLDLAVATFLKFWNMFVRMASPGIEWSRFRGFIMVQPFWVPVFRPRDRHSIKHQLQHCWQVSALLCHLIWRMTAKSSKAACLAAFLPRCRVITGGHQVGGQGGRWSSCNPLKDIC